MDDVQKYRVWNVYTYATDTMRFIAGRQALIIVDRKCAGVFGEVHPAVILNFGLDQPVIAYEMWELDR